MPGSPLPRRECESRPLRVGFAFGARRSARSRRNGLETLEGYKGGLLTHSECSGLPGPRPSVSSLLQLGPNTRLAGPGSLPGRLASTRWQARLLPQQRGCAGVTVRRWPPSAGSAASSLGAEPGAGLWARVL